MDSHPRIYLPALLHAWVTVRQHNIVVWIRIREYILRTVAQIKMIYCVPSLRTAAPAQRCYSRMRIYTTMLCWRNRHPIRTFPPLIEWHSFEWGSFEGPAPCLFPPPVRMRTYTYTIVLVRYDWVPVAPTQQCCVDSHTRIASAAPAQQAVHN